MRILGDYEGAKQGYLRALEINRKALGEDHTEYAMTLENLSTVLADLGDYEGAKQGKLRALEIFRKAFGEDHYQYARTLGNLSSV